MLKSPVHMQPRLKQASKHSGVPTRLVTSNTSGLLTQVVLAYGCEDLSARTCSEASSMRASTEVYTWPTCKTRVCAGTFTRPRASEACMNMKTYLKHSLGMQSGSTYTCPCARGCQKHARMHEDIHVHALSA